MLTRRLLVTGSAIGLTAVAAATLRPRHLAAAEAFPIRHTDQEWRAKLTQPAYAVLRQADTEPPFTSPLLNEHRTGIFTCAGCDTAAFASTTKFDSGTGWPSFWAPLPKAVSTEQDASLGMDRTEVHRAQCGGHLGHVFDDGPQPTGQRYCMNGVALNFRPSV